MSEEMARKKKEEIEALETMEKELKENTKEDLCPVCGLPTNQIKFFNPQIIQMFGWVECTRCGAVYCPASIRKQKNIMAKGGLTQVQPAILPPK